MLDSPLAQDLQAAIIQAKSPDANASAGRASKFWQLSKGGRVGKKLIANAEARVDGMRQSKLDAQEADVLTVQLGFLSQTSEITWTTWEHEVVPCWAKVDLFLSKMSPTFMSTHWDPPTTDMLGLKTEFMANLGARVANMCRWLCGKTVATLEATIAWVKEQEEGDTIPELPDDFKKKYAQCAEARTALTKPKLLRAP